MAMAYLEKSIQHNEVLREKIQKCLNDSDASLKHAAVRFWLALNHLDFMP